MGIDEIREYVDNIANFVSSKKLNLNLTGSLISGLLSDIIDKEVKFLIFLTCVYLITLIVKQRSKTMYRYLVSLTIAVIAIYTFKVTTVFDESIKNGNPTPEIIKGLPPVCICLVIKLFQIVPPLKLVYYALPVLMIAYSIYRNILSHSSSKSSKPSKSSKSSKSSKKPSQSTSHSNKKKGEKSVKNFLIFGLSIFTDFIHSFYLFYAYAVLVLLIFINNNFEYTINSMNTGSNLYGKILNILDIPFFQKK